MKVCAEPGCPALQPCERHPKTGWANSKRSSRVKSGSAQQRDAAFVMRRDRGVCHVCRQPGADEVDHVVPVAEGGADTLDNKAPIHARPCHVEKTAAESKRAKQRR